MTMQENLYKNYYTTQSSRYSADDLSTSSVKTARHYKKEIVPLLPKNKEVSILEVGCGYGTLLSALADNGYNNIRGIDKSHEQVSIAEKQGITCVEEGDLLSFLENHDGKFDVIIGVDVIEHLEKDELLEFLSLAHNALNKNGTILLRTPNGDAPFGSTYYFGDFTHRLVLNSFSAEQIMISSGFKNVHIFSSKIIVDGYIKEFGRKAIWACVIFVSKLLLFASGKSTKGVLFTPNIILTGSK